MDMGSIIYCETKETKTAFVFENTRIAVYSYEELCYYIFQNFSMITLEQIGCNLLTWMNDKLEMTDLVKRLRNLLQAGCNLYEYLEVLLLGANYYEKEEVYLLFERMKEEEKFPTHIRLKRQADNFVQFHKYTKAISIYNEILQQHDLLAEFTSQVLHNKAVALAKNWDILEARKYYLKAWRTYENELSLSCYFVTFFLAKDEENARKQKELLAVSDETYEHIVGEYQRSREYYQQSNNFQEYQKIQMDLQTGQEEKAKTRVERLLKNWKEDYRMQNR